MSDERLTILEMEYALVSARLGTIDAELALLNKRVDSVDTKVDQTIVALHELGNDIVNLATKMEGRFDSVDRKLAVIIDHFDIGGDS